MALPIGATPVLRGEEAVRFIVRVHRNANKPVSIVPTPKLGQASKLIQANASSRKPSVKK